MPVRYLTIPEDSAVALREHAERLTEMRALIDSTLALCNALLDNAGHLTIPETRPAISELRPASPARLPAVRVAADTAVAESGNYLEYKETLTSLEDESDYNPDTNAGDDTSEGTPRKKYDIVRGNWGMNYADVIDLEVLKDHFTTAEAIEIIRPLVNARPESWNRAVRRSLLADSKNRFVAVPGIQGITWHRTTPLAARTDLFGEIETADHPRANADDSAVSENLVGEGT